MGLSETRSPGRERSRVVEALRRAYESRFAPESPASPAAGRPDVASHGTPADAGSPSAAISGSERRELPRRDSACSVQICIVPGGEPVQSHRVEWLLHAAQQCGPLVDVSLRSVSIRLPVAVAAGERVLLRMQNRRLGKEVDRAARVIRSVPRHGEWKVVCRFDEPLLLEELQHFARFQFESACV